MAHRIRLRKPWTRHDLVRPALPAADGGEQAADGGSERDSAQPAPTTSAVTHHVDVPDPTSGAEAGTDLLAGDQPPGSSFQATYCRRFNRPSGIATGDRVQLELGEVAGRLVDIRINSNSLASFADGELRASERYDITAVLADRNDLEIEVHETDVMPRLRGAVNLWIVPQA